MHWLHLLLCGSVYAGDVEDASVGDVSWLPYPPCAVPGTLVEVLFLCVSDFTSTYWPRELCRFDRWTSPLERAIVLVSSTLILMFGFFVCKKKMSLFCCTLGASVERGSTKLLDEGRGIAQPQPIRERDCRRSRGQQAEVCGLPRRGASLLPHASKVQMCSPLSPSKS